MFFLVGFFVFDGGGCGWYELVIWVELVVIIDD